VEDDLVHRKLAVLSALFVGFSTPTFAQQSVEDFYRGKTIDFIVGSESGSSYDSFARLLSRHMKIPGNPNFVVKNMPGAGHIKATNYLYSSAAKDGTVIGIISQLVPTATVLKNKPGLEADFTKFRWLGSTDSARQVCVVRQASAIKSGEDLFTQKLIVGGTGAGSGVTAIPTFLRDLFGMKFDIVMGYKNSGDVMLAMDRGEVDGVCQTYQGVEHSRPGQMASGQIRLLFNLEKEPIPGTNAPTVRQFARSQEQRLLADFFSANNDLGRPLITPPGIPDDRLTALRNAFDAAVRSKDYLEEAEKQHLDTNSRSGREQEADFRAILATPPEIIKLAEKYM
jgi:tripartite-type tricarboxylate transporter receptor subunit TctC